MFNVQPDKRWFGFHLEPPEDPPGFRKQLEYMTRGYKIGQSGVFDPPPPR